MERINAHLDRKCESDVSETQKSQWNKLLNGKGKEKADNDELDEDPIPKASYDTLKDKQLKRLLEECDLPTTGDRVAWLARHQKWRNIFNSNLDKARKYRRTKSDLQRDMRKWEEERKRGLKKPVSVDDTLAYEVTTVSILQRVFGL
ncbi:hypothetical protein FISHEDRAFT_70340 [Fistulina hepatica ATCC 64428]|uniref:SAP domain-containing protein n=1 Tax=Fistulina hepatica ATCC 64428 TaxID=1128425 RepID=A0A0D7AKL4_9AGAR|nr:hypothetical protein FISHEDRAFT_70340 [Fistulina hepatica ATCC 64428]